MDLNARDLYLIHMSINARRDVLWTRAEGFARDAEQLPSIAWRCEADRVSALAEYDELAALLDRVMDEPR